MAKLIKTDRTSLEVTPKNGKTFSLDEMYELVGCEYVQFVYLKEGRIMVIDEEGKFNDDKEENDIATDMAHKDEAIFPADYIVGDVLVCESTEIE